MSELVRIVYESVINLHMRTGEEWIPLRDIYKEVDRIRDKGINNGGASVRAALEKHSSLSTAFTGKEYFILKSKGTGLYKCVYYDRLKLIREMSIGDVFTYEQIKDIFKVSGQSGIMKTNTLNCLIIITSENNGIYDDGNIKNGTIIYTGEGQEGDQELVRNNKTLYGSKANELPVYLFSKDNKGRYVFEGRVELYNDPYQSVEEDINHRERLVWKFPLRILYPDDYDYENDSKLEDISYKVLEIENEIIDGMDSSENLIFNEGTLNIRKFRTTGRKNKRSSKPDYIAAEIEKTAQGIKNEKYVLEKEIEKLMEKEAIDQIQKMKEFFDNKKENEGFDILSFELNNNNQYDEKYIEVKSTKSGETTPIDITADEIEFMKNNLDSYYLYRIYTSRDGKKEFKVISGKDLFLNYNFVPTAYKIYSK